MKMCDVARIKQIVIFQPAMSEFTGGYIASHVGLLDHISMIITDHSKTTTNVDHTKLSSARFKPFIPGIFGSCFC